MIRVRDTRSIKGRNRNEHKSQMLRADLFKEIYKQAVECLMEDDERKEIIYLPIKRF